MLMLTPGTARATAGRAAGDAGAGAGGYPAASGIAGVERRAAVSGTAVKRRNRRSAGGGLSGIDAGCNRNATKERCVLRSWSMRCKYLLAAPCWHSLPSAWRRRFRGTAASLPSRRRSNRWRISCRAFSLARAAFSNSDQVKGHGQRQLHRPAEDHFRQDRPHLFAIAVLRRCGAAHLHRRRSADQDLRRQPAADRPRGELPDRLNVLDDKPLSARWPTKAC